MYDDLRLVTSGTITLEFRCFGSFAFQSHSGWCKGPARTRGGELLEYLATHVRAAASRELLYEVLWPNLDTEQSSHRLHVAASGARAALRRELNLVNPIVFVDGAYAWSSSIRVRTDIDVVESCLADGSAEALIRGVKAYSGQFLAGATADWVMPLRTRYEHMYVTMLESLATKAYEAHDYARATHYALELIAADGAHERATQLAMLGLAKAGRRTLALVECDRLEQHLRKWLGVGLTSETRTLRAQILRGEIGLSISDSTSGGEGLTRAPVG